MPLKSSYNKSIIPTTFKNVNHAAVLYGRV